MHDPKPVLLVEDDDLDALIVKRSMNRLGITNELIHARDGETALVYLSTRTPADCLPCVILLDLNMPRMNGFEFLGHIRDDSYFKAIPVVVITTSAAQEDRTKSLQLGATAFIIKSYDYRTFLQNLATITSYCHCPEQACCVSTQHSPGPANI